jgi:hypothetical protein
MISLDKGLGKPHSSKAFWNLRGSVVFEKGNASPARQETLPS